MSGMNTRPPAVSTGRSSEYMLADQDLLESDNGVPLEKRDFCQHGPSVFIFLTFILLQPVLWPRVMTSLSGMHTQGSSL